MLKRSPFMFYVNAPKIGDEDLSHVVDRDVSATASGFVAYGALSVLQLLSAQNFPDLDKLVRTQPSILLVDTSEVKLRAEFLVNLFLENMPSIADTAAQNSDLSTLDNGLDLELSHAPTTSSEGVKSAAKSKFQKNKSKNLFASSQVVYAAQEIDRKKSYSTGTFGSLRLNEDLGSYDEVSANEPNSNQHLAHDMLGALLLTYPAVLSVNHA